MILYVEIPKNSTKNILKLINKFSKVAGYKLNPKRSIICLYINNEQFKKKIKGTIQFTRALKRVKYIVINLTKGSKDLYTENDKIILK